MKYFIHTIYYGHYLPLTILSFNSINLVCYYIYSLYVGKEQKQVRVVKLEKEITKVNFQFSNEILK